MMHILLAPDSFKESLSAVQVAEALKEGFSQALPEATFDLLPIGDGGEGTVAALISAMKLKELFQAYEFDEIYPQIGLMFPKGRHLRVQFGNAYNLLLTLNPVASKKQIRYQLMEDPDTNEMFYGADDHDFNGPWEVLLGKEVKKEPKVDLTNEELVANCLLNTVLIGRHPRSFEKDYQAIVK